MFLSSFDIFIFIYLFDVPNLRSLDMILYKLWEVVKDRTAWRAAVHGVTKIQTDLVTKQQQQQWGLSFSMQDLQLQLVGSFSVAACRFLVGSSSLTRD